MWWRELWEAILRERFNNTCFPTSEEYLSFMVPHKEKWNCSRATSHWDETERGNTLCLSVFSLCACLCDCKHGVRASAHLCLNIHRPQCVSCLFCMREHLQRDTTTLGDFKARDKGAK